jgi:hypothetical protein
MMSLTRRVARVRRITAVLRTHRRYRQLQQEDDVSDGEILLVQMLVASQRANIDDATPSPSSFFASRRVRCDSVCSHKKNTIETKTNEDDTTLLGWEHIAAILLQASSLQPTSFIETALSPQPNRIELNLLPHPVLASSQCVLLCLELLWKHYFPSNDPSIET